MSTEAGTAMRGPRFRSAWWLLFAVLAIGCDPAPPPGQSAHAAAQAYAEAIVQRDWPGAYATLHPDSRTRCQPQRFAARAQSYYRTLGFEPAKMHVQSCEEQGTKAIAHFVFIGRTPSGQRRYKDAVLLQQVEGGWGVILPRKFGQ